MAQGPKINPGVPIITDLIDSRDGVDSIVRYKIKFYIQDVGLSETDIRSFFATINEQAESLGTDRVTFSDAQIDAAVAFLARDPEWVDFTDTLEDEGKNLLSQLGVLTESIEKQKNVFTTSIGSLTLAGKDDFWLRPFTDFSKISVSRGANTFEMIENGTTYVIQIPEGEYDLADFVTLFNAVMSDYGLSISVSGTYSSDQAYAVVQYTNSTYDWYPNFQHNAINLVMGSYYDIDDMEDIEIPTGEYLVGLLPFRIGRKVLSGMSTTNGNQAIFRTTKSGTKNTISGSRIKVDVHLVYDDGRSETENIGEYKIKEQSFTNKGLSLKLQNDAQALKDLEAKSVKNGTQWYKNRKVAFLVRKLLELEYGSPLPESFYIPEVIRTVSIGYERGLTGDNRSSSQLGSPPEFVNGQYVDNYGKVPTAQVLWDFASDVENKGGGYVSFPIDNPDFNYAGGPIPDIPRHLTVSRTSPDIVSIVDPDTSFNTIGIKPKVGDTLQISSDNYDRNVNGFYTIEEMGSDGDWLKVSPPFPFSNENTTVTEYTFTKSSEFSEWSISNIYVALEDEVWEYNQSSEEWTRLFSIDEIIRDNHDGTWNVQDNYLEVFGFNDYWPRDEKWIVKRLWRNPISNTIMGVAWQDLMVDHDPFDGVPAFVFQFGQKSADPSYQEIPESWIGFVNNQYDLDTDSWVSVRTLHPNLISGDYVYRKSGIGTGFADYYPTLSPAVSRSNMSLPIHTVGSFAFPFGSTTGMLDSRSCPSVVYSTPFGRNMDLPLFGTESGYLDTAYMFATEYGETYATTEGQDRNFSSPAIYSPFNQKLFVITNTPAQEFFPQDIQSYTDVMHPVYFSMKYPYWQGKVDFATAKNPVRTKGLVYSLPSFYEILSGKRCVYSRDDLEWYINQQDETGADFFTSGYGLGSHGTLLAAAYYGIYYPYLIGIDVLGNPDLDDYYIQNSVLPWIALQDLFCTIPGGTTSYEIISDYSLPFFGDTFAEFSSIESEYNIWRSSAVSKISILPYYKSPGWIKGEEFSSGWPYQQEREDWRETATSKNVSIFPRPGKNSSILNTGFHIFSGGFFHAAAMYGTTGSDARRGEVASAHANIDEILNRAPSLKYHIGQEGSVVDCLVQRGSTDGDFIGFVFFDNGGSQVEGSVTNYYNRLRVYNWTTGRLGTAGGGGEETKLSLFSGGNDFTGAAAEGDSGYYTSHGVGKLHAIPLSVTHYSSSINGNQYVSVSAIGFEEYLLDDGVSSGSKFCKQASQGTGIHKCIVDLTRAYSTDFIDTGFAIPNSPGYSNESGTGYTTATDSDTYNIREHGAYVALNISGISTGDVFAVIASLKDQEVFTSKHYRTGVIQTNSTASVSTWPVESDSDITGIKYFRNLPQSLSSRTDLSIYESGVDGIYQYLYFVEQGSMVLWKASLKTDFNYNVDTITYEAMNTRFPVVTGANWNNIPLIVDYRTRNGIDKTNQTVIHGIASTDPWYWSQEKKSRFNPLWSYDVYYSNRVLIADFSELKVWDALSKLAQKINYIVGFSSGDFYMIPDTPYFYKGYSPEFAFRHEISSLSLDEGIGEIFNTCNISPGIIKEPELQYTYVFSSDRENPNLTVNLVQSDDRHYHLRLSCVKSGEPDPLIELDSNGDPVSPEYLYSSYASYRYRLYVNSIETSVSSRSEISSDIIYVAGSVEDVKKGDEIELSFVENRVDGVSIVFTGIQYALRDSTTDDIINSRIQLAESFTFEPDSGSYTTNLSYVPIGSDVVIKSSLGSWSDTNPNMVPNGNFVDWKKNETELLIPNDTGVRWRKSSNSTWEIRPGGEDRGGYSLKVVGKGVDYWGSILWYDSSLGSVEYFHVTSDVDTALTEDLYFTVSFWIRVNVGKSNLVVRILTQNAANDTNYVINYNAWANGWGQDAGFSVGFANAYQDWFKNGVWQKFSYTFKADSGEIDPKIQMYFINMSSTDEVDFEVEKIQLVTDDTTAPADYLRTLDITQFGQLINIPNTGLSFSLNAETNANVQNFLSEKDYLDITSTGNIIEVDDKSIQSAVDLTSKEEYGLKEFTYPDNRFVSHAEALDLSKRRVWENAFPRYGITMVFNTLLPSLRFMKNKNRNSITVISPEYFPTSSGTARTGVIRKITHDFSKKQTVIVIKDYDEY